MSTSYDVRLTVGHVLRHAPAQSAQGREAALIDIAQDLLLRHLHDRGALDVVAFKGGTALRKVYAGAGGRFSTDLDFTIASGADDPSAVVELLVGEIAGVTLGPFRYGVEERRGRYHVRYESDLGVAGATGALQSKIDVGPPPWLPPTTRPWVELPVHARYGGPLPALPVVLLEENLAEKIARLNRRTPARDAYDLVWVIRQPIAVDRGLVRRLAVLKAWVDQHGLTSTTGSWSPLPDARPFDVDRWLTPRRRRDFDDEDIGLLTAPPPDLDELGADLSTTYRWLADFDADERAVARGDAGDRAAVLRLLGSLPGGRMAAGYW